MRKIQSLRMFTRTPSCIVPLVAELLQIGWKRVRVPRLYKVTPVRSVRRVNALGGADRGD